VIGATVAAYFNGIAAATTVHEFQMEYDQTRVNLAAQVRNALMAWGVESISTNLGTFQAEDSQFNKELQKEAAARLRHRELIVALENVEIEDKIDEIRVRAERRRAAIELEAEINAIGRNNAAMIHIIREFANVQVPDYIGGSDVSRIMEQLPMGILPDLLERLHGLRRKQNTTQLTEGKSNNLQELTTGTHEDHQGAEVLDAAEDSE